MKSAAILVVSLWAAGLCEAQEALVKDTHRVILRNGNMIDGVLREQSDAGVLLSYAPSSRVFIRWGEIRAIEQITIRPLQARPKRIDPPKPPPSNGASEPVGKSPAPEPISKEPLPSDKIQLPTIPADLKQRIDELLDLVRSTPPERRGRFAESLDSLGEAARRYMAVRIELLPDDLVRFTVSEIGRSKDRSLIPELRKRLDSDRPIVRAAAIQLLLELQDTESASRIVQHLTDPDAGVRGSAAAALPELGDESCIDPLLRLMREPAPQVRRIALNSVVEVARRKGRLAEVVAYWQSNVRSSTEGAREDVAASAAMVIPNLGSDEDGEGTSTRGIMEQMLVDLSEDREAAVRAAAYRALAKLGTPRARETLVASLPGERNDAASLSVITAVLEIREREAIPELIERLGSSSDRVRDAAFAALKAITGEGSLPADVQLWREWHGRK